MELCNAKVLTDSPTAPPATVPSTATTAAPPVPTKFCQGALKRDVVLLVDTLASPSKDDKITALTALGKTFADGIPFEFGTRVAVITLNDGQRLGDFATDVASFNDVWGKLLALPFTGVAGSIDVSQAYGAASQLLKQLNPIEVILVTDHILAPLDPSADIRQRGVFVSAVIPTKINLPGIDKLTTVRKSYATWAEMVTQNPFATLFCQYTDGAPPTKAASFAAKADANDDTPKCQKLDIIVVFDTSQSVVEPFVRDYADFSIDFISQYTLSDTPKCQKLDIIVVFDTSQSVVEPFVRDYADFSIDFISQYTLSGAVDGDNTRTGIISFNSDVQIVRELGERPLSDFKTAVSGIHYTGGTTNTLAAMKAGRDMFMRQGGTTHGRAMVFLSDGQPYPMTPDTWAEIVSVGNDLKGLGVDIFFVGDDNGYDDATKSILSNITGNPDWVFNHVADARIGLSPDLLKEFPCPPLICEMAYYAVEISEILSEQDKNMSLNFILEVAQNVYNNKNSTQFQLLVYNDQQFLLPHDGDYSFANFKSVVICEMAYYAVEISEILSDQDKNTSLNFILEVAQNVYNNKNSTQFQLLVYNDQQFLLPHDGDYSFANFKSVVSQLISNTTYRERFSSGHTRIDTAINALAREMNVQQKRRPFFQSSVLFAGQANSGVLDPIGNEAQQKADLAQAAKNLKTICPLVYALDDSSNNVPIYGDDLWNIVSVHLLSRPFLTAVKPVVKVVPAERTIRITSDNLERDLENTDYYQKVNALDCKLPSEARCDLNFVDFGVAFDVNGPLTANITDYVRSLLGQFNTIYTAHISMYGFGGGRQPTILASLSSHQSMNDGFNNLTNWQNGITTTAAPTTTTTPTTVVTTTSPTTIAATTSKSQKKAEFLELAGVPAVTPQDINGLFNLIRSQFGCGSYSDDADRILAPNVIMIVSDNFAAYQNVWQQFERDSQNGWKCDDCPGTPAYVFLSATNDVAPQSLGVTYTINEAEDFELSSSMKAVNIFNSIVNGVCTMPLRSCCTYTVPNGCRH
ncbi:von Willebrand factor type A domain protein [Ancylostoma caninum]|uniref:von Willebrand factor type A domain protein n=1 Tax=Ancylostoma caninum TaxID=29170 RepID=A0A368GDC3_ANCCA|nr:von Willebrand factor type A domain protein [Ancylostoma caninum]